MTIKKTVLLAAAAMALLAFAAPAAASADQWYTSTSENPAEDVLVGGPGEGDEIHLQGPLVFTWGGPSSGTKVTCETTTRVEIWNEGGTATGEYTNAYFLIAPGCEASFANGLLQCELTEGAAAAGHIDVMAGATGMDLTELDFTYTFKGCPVIEVAGFSGNLTGTWNAATSCIEFSEDGELFMGSTPLLVDGRLCDTTGNLTLK